MSFADLLEQFVSELTGIYGGEIESARAQYFKRCGEPFQDEPAYEIRLRNFIEWYLFDFVLDHGLTPYESFMADPEKPAEKKNQYLPFRDQRHSVFIVEKVGSGELVLNDLWVDDQLRVVYEETAGLPEGAALETRLVWHEGKLHTTNTSVYHTPESAKFIKKRAKELRDAKRIQDWRAFLYRTGYLQLKAGRYKHVEGETIYREILNDTPAA